MRVPEAGSLPAGPDSVAPMEIIETKEGPAAVYRRGVGPLAVVLHGGPGFDHGYLVDAFKFLEHRRELVYFDQPGCGATPNPRSGATLRHTVRHAHALIAALSSDRRVDVIAHSWGALVYCGVLALACSESGGPSVNRALLVNPLPVCRDGYDVVRRRLVARLPTATRLAALWRLFRGGGQGVMELLMPYYVPEPRKLMMPPLTLNLRTYLQVTARLGAFDFSAALGALDNAVILHGASDIASEADIAALTKAASALREMPGTGHFPFYEEPVAFACLADNVFPRCPSER